MLSPPPEMNFVSTTKNLLKNRNWTSPIVSYFTWKLEFVLNVLWMIIGTLGTTLLGNMLTGKAVKPGIPGWEKVRADEVNIRAG